MPIALLTSGSCDLSDTFGAGGSRLGRNNVPVASIQVTIPEIASLAS